MLPIFGYGKVKHTTLRQLDIAATHSGFHKHGAGPYIAPENRQDHSQERYDMSGYTSRASLVVLIILIACKIYITDDVIRYCFESQTINAYKASSIWNHSVIKC